jgi:hypothetical protein
MGNAPTTFDPPGQSDLNGKGVVQCQTASFPPAAANAGPHDASTVNKASIDRSPVVTATKVGHGPQLLNFTATGSAGGTAAVRRRRCYAASPLALVFLALVLFCGVDGGWAVFTPFIFDAGVVAEAQETSFASFEHDTNGTILHIPIIHRSQDEIDDPNVCRRLIWEGQSQGKFLKDVSLLVLLLREMCVVNFELIHCFHVYFLFQLFLMCLFSF